MSDIERYDMIASYVGAAMEKRDDGDWVDYEDYERLAAINDELIEALEAIVKHQSSVGGKLAVFSGTRAIAKSAIEKAKHDGSDRN